jgi:HD superfamily phosphohydrolase
MYKNVYFHKTSRAADQMLQEVLKSAYDILDLPNRVEDLDEFTKLTDQRIVDELEVLYDSIYGKNAKFSLKTESMKNIEKLEYAHTIIDRLRKRDLWKMVKELPFSTTGVDPSVVSISVAEDFLKKLNKNIKEVQKTDIDKNDKEQLYYIV